MRKMIRMFSFISLLSLLGCDLPSDKKLIMEPIYLKEAQITSNEIIMKVSEKNTSRFINGKMYYIKQGDNSRFGFWLSQKNEYQYDFWMLERRHADDEVREYWLVYSTLTKQVRRFGGAEFSSEQNLLNDFRAVAWAYEPIKKTDQSPLIWNGPDFPVAWPGLSRLEQTIDDSTRLPSKYRAYNKDNELIYQIDVNQFGRSHNYWSPIRLTITDFLNERTVRIKLLKESFSGSIPNPFINDVMQGSVSVL